MSNWIGAVLIVLGTNSMLVVAADWPQFRGPNGTSVAPDSKPPRKWTSKDGVTWAVPLPGPGSSSPIIVGERVFVTCYSGYGVEAQAPGIPEKLTRHLVCVDRNTGKINWKRDVPTATAEDPYRGYLTEHGYASHTPVSDGEAVYVFFGKSGVLAFDLTGKQLWQTSVGTGSDIRGWGSAASPVLYKELVIVNASSEGKAVVALSKKTGQEIWRAGARQLSLSFGTPALVQLSSGRTDLVVAMPSRVWGIDPDNGKQRWTATIKPDGNISPSVIAGDGMAYVTGGYQSKGSLALKPPADGVETGKPLWETRTSSYVPTPLLSGGRIYCVNEDGFAQCLNAADGTLIYSERLTVKKGGRPFYASPTLANSHLYIPSRRSGVYVLKAGDKFEQVELNPPLDDTDFNGSIGVVGNQLFFRSNSHLYCVGAK